MTIHGNRVAAIRRAGSAFLLVALILSSTACKDRSGAGRKTISVIEINDLHGALVGREQSWSHGDVVGGAAWLAGYLNIIRDENAGGVLFLDVGDSIHGTLISNYLEGASTIDVLNRIGIDASVVGNHEFDWGLEVLLERMRQARFPILAANIFIEEGCREQDEDRDGRPDWAVPFVIRTVHGIKVGLVGVTTVTTPSIVKSACVEHLDFRDPAAAIVDLVPEMEAEGATIIVVLAHLGGYPPLDSRDEVYRMAMGLDPGHIDLICSGHTHLRLDEVVNDIPIVQAYSGGTAFSRVDLIVDERTGERVDCEMNDSATAIYQTYRGEPAAYRRWDTGGWETVEPDSGVAMIINRYEAGIEDLMNLAVGETTLPITRDSRYESVMGDWVADIMRTYVHVPGIDFAFTNSGGLRADIDAGEMIYGDVFEALPFDNSLVVVELDGNEVRQVLEEGITGDHGLIQVSGLRFTFDYNLPAGSRIVGDIVDLSTGLPLDPGSTYSVGVNDFMASGRDGYDTLADNPQVNTYVLVRDLVISWSHDFSPFTPPDPAVEKRITALGTPP